MIPGASAPGTFFVFAGMMIDMKLQTRYALVALGTVIIIGAWTVIYFLRQNSPFASTYKAPVLSLPFTIPKVGAPEPRATTTTIIAVGDIMTSRNVAAKMRLYGNDYPFASSTDFLSSADITFANLETPITAGPIVPTGSFSFHADPGSELALKKAGIDVLSLANNHSPNYGDKGLIDTIAYLDAQQLYHTGAGRNIEEAREPAIIEHQGIRFAFIAFNDSDVVPPLYGASSNHGGTAIMTAENLQAALSLAKAQADVVIVSMHSGTEYTRIANERQVAFAHQAIDLGADVVIGSHPHVVQNIERYKGKYIFYSLGNFVFDQMFSEETREGLAVKLSFKDKEIDDVQLYPFKIYNFAQPKPLHLDEAQDIHSRFDIAVSTTTTEGLSFWQIDK